MVSVCGWRVTGEHLGSMLWFSPSWIDQILNLPTALPLVAQIRSSHLNYRRRSDSARGVQNDRTEQTRSGYKPAAVSISAKQVLPQIASACGAAQRQRNEAILILPDCNLQVSLWPSAPLQPGPDFPKLEHPGTCSSTRGPRWRILRLLASRVRTCMRKGGAALSQRLL